jgi:hypothetical protein
MATSVIIDARIANVLSNESMSLASRMFVMFFTTLFPEMVLCTLFILMYQAIFVAQPTVEYPSLFSPCTVYQTHLRFH